MWICSPLFWKQPGLPENPRVIEGDGESILAAFRGEKSFERSKPIFWFWQGKHSGDDWPAWAMRDRQWMLVMDETQERRELYDVIADREQKNDLAGAEPERVKSMVAAINRWKAELPTELDPKLQTKVSPRSRTKTNSKSKTPPDRDAIFSAKRREQRRATFNGGIPGSLSGSGRRQAAFPEF